MSSTLRCRFPAFGRAAAVLAFLAQLTLAFAGLGEGRAGLGYTAHIDPGGTSTHYVHDEAVCAACQARSIHSVVRQAAPPAIAPRPRAMAAVIWLESHRDSKIYLPHSSRAPPTLS